MGPHPLDLAGLVATRIIRRRSAPNLGTVMVMARTREELHLLGPLPRLLLWSALVGWLLVHHFVLAPSRIALDWNGWRQADTATMALEFMKPDGCLLYPRIAWGGDGPGYVESELALFPHLVAYGMRWVGAHEWVGQAFAAVFMILATGFLFELLHRRFGSLPAVAGSVALAGSKAVVLLTISAQREALCVLA